MTDRRTAVSALALTVLLLGVMAYSLTPVYANPPGVPSTVGKKVFQFNLIGHPKGYTGDCGDGRRVFVDRNKVNGHINLVNGSEWAILDCNSTGSNVGEIQVGNSGNVSIWVIVARIMGKPGGTLTICADFVTDLDGVFCTLGNFSLTRGTGKSSFDIVPSALFDTSLEGVLWTYNTTDFRVAQFRVYEAT